jgi:hypothetical protein
MTVCSLRRNDGSVVLSRIIIAASFVSRLRGLSFRSEPQPDTGLLITKCRAIHTHWMRYSIDVAMLNASGEVLLVRRSLPPWRMLSGPTGTACVIETCSGGLSLIEGDRVCLVLSPFPLSLPRGLRTLRPMLSQDH